jgi:hypothetical protein
MGYGEESQWNSNSKVVTSYLLNQYQGYLCLKGKLFDVIVIAISMCCLMENNIPQANDPMQISCLQNSCVLMILAIKVL